MARLFIEIVNQVVAELPVPVRQVGADGHEQRHGVPHVVPGLGQERHIAGAADLAG